MILTLTFSHLSYVTFHLFTALHSYYDVNFNNFLNTFAQLKHHSVLFLAQLHGFLSICAISKPKCANWKMCLGKMDLLYTKKCKIFIFCFIMTALPLLNRHTTLVL